MPVYATKLALDTEVAARRAGDQKEAGARTVAVNALDARLDAVEAWIAAQPTGPINTTILVPRIEPVT